MSDRIRQAHLSDVDALVDLENRIFPTDRISRRSFRRLLASRSAAVLVVAERTGLTGYAVILQRRGSAVARLYSLAVAPALSGAGAGRTLLEAAEEIGRRGGRCVMRLEVRDDNARAIRLYEKTGYRRIGRRPGYYEDGAAALCFEKSLRVWPGRESTR